MFPVFESGVAVGRFTPMLLQSKFLFIYFFVKYFEMVISFVCQRR